MKEKLVAFGSGNIFEDIGVPSPAEHLIKADLVIRIADVISERELTQNQAAEIMEIPQSKVSLLTRGQFRDFSVERLCRILNNLGVTVSMVLSDEPGWHKGSTAIFSRAPVVLNEIEPEEIAEEEIAFAP